MATKKKPTTATTSIEAPSMRLRRPPNAPMVQNFRLVWLDGGIGEINNDDCRNSITKLRQVVNTVNAFIYVDQCIDFITETKDEMTFMIISGDFSRNIVPIVQEIPQVNSIYIFCENKVNHEIWAKEWSKVKGVFADIISICEALKQAAQDCDQNSVSLNFVKTTAGSSNQNLDTLDQSFMYTQILKEILLTIDFEQSHIDEFLTYCRDQLAGNTIQLENIDKLQTDYRHYQPIWWYTYGCFLYPMLNRALRLMEVDLIITMGFFIRDLHNQIAQLHSEQYAGQDDSHSFTVYRGQGLSQTDFDQLKNTQGGLMSFNNFVSTSLDRAVSFAFAESNRDNPNLIGVLFEVTINPSISTYPFANVKNESYYQGEEEILFSMHSVFRIGQVKQIDGNARLWQVNLTLTGDNDPQLHALTEHMREETFPHMKGWCRLGALLIKLDQFDKAQQVCDIMFDQTTEPSDKAFIHHILGIVKRNQGKYEEAVGFYEESIKINRKNFPSDCTNLVSSYSNIGTVYNSMGEYSKALSYYDKALEIYQKTLPTNHPDLATSYSNIGTTYNSMGEYSKALSYYEKALEICQKTLPTNHPHLATSYNNIGTAYYSMGEYSKALSYYEKALEINKKILPTNHPHLAASYNHIGLVYYNVCEYSKALSYYEQLLEVRQKTLPANHPDLATSYNKIGSVFDNMGEYSKALISHEKTLEIYQKTLPANHPHLAASYNIIGLVYNNMGKYSKALSYYEKAIEVRQKNLPANHPDLATSYNNIGLVYYNMCEYSKTLPYYEKALEIYQKTLPTNHPDLATSYSNIGTAYYRVGEYSKALSYYAKALEIYQKTLPANHPHLAASYSNIGLVYYKMGDYSKSLSYLESALDTYQRSLPPNHPNIQSVKESIENVKEKL